MKVKRIFAPDMRQAMRRVREEIGADAVIISNHRVAGGVEVVAAREEDYEQAQAEMLRSKARAPREEAVAAPRIQPRRSDPDLAEELKRVERKISEARRVAEQPIPVLDHTQNKQIDDEDDEDLRFILSSLKTQDDARSRAEPKDSFASDDWSDAPQSAAKPVRQPPQEDDLIRVMQQEIHQLRSMMQEQIGRVQEPPVRAKPAPYQHPASVIRVTESRFQQMGLSARLIQQLVSSIESDLSEEDAWRNALGRFADAIPVVGEEFIERGGMIAFVGATGVGKTTTIGKLAARYVLQHGSSSLALVTTDCFRIAAHEQLKTFGRILDVPVRVVDENHSLEEVLLSLRGKRLVLIDTAGMNTRDLMGKTQMDMFSSVSMRIKKLLVFSCSSQRQLLRSTYEIYKELNLNACVLTKMDESGSVGEALSLVVEKQLPIAYVTDGQKIPDDLIVAQRRDLVSRAVVVSQRHSSDDESEPVFRAG